jgi:hypothetical protein
LDYPQDARRSPFIARFFAFWRGVTKKNTSKHYQSNPLNNAVLDNAAWILHRKSQFSFAHKKAPLENQRGF